MTGSVSARSASVNVPAGAQRRAERLEVAGRDHLPVGGERCSRRSAGRPSMRMPQSPRVLASGRPVTAPAACTPGDSRSRRPDLGVGLHHRGRIRHTVGAGSDVRSVSTCAGLKPASTSSSRAKLRASSIAAATSTTDAGDLADDEHAAQPAGGDARIAAAFLQHRLQVGARRLQRRHDAEQDAGDERRSPP